MSAIFPAKKINKASNTECNLQLRETLRSILPGENNKALRYSVLFATGDIPSFTQLNKNIERQIKCSQTSILTSLSSTFYSSPFYR